MGCFEELRGFIQFLTDIIVAFIEHSPMLRSCALCTVQRSNYSIKIATILNMYQFCDWRE